MTLQDDARAELLDTITDKARLVDEAKEVLDARQAELNAAVFKGKNKKLKYREIATASKRSVAWVQAVLNKSGYRTRNQVAEDATAV